MLSINIPVYNTEVNNLVLELQNQARKLNIPFEIRVYDDGSLEEFKMINREIARVSNVIYYELKENIGRAAIRNLMGADSNFGWLLFMDADSKPVDTNYLKNFLNHRRENWVLCGGTVYSDQKPDEPEKQLRWKYGTVREAVSAEIRNSKKGFIITSNNFLIEKRVFDKIHFREDIRNYGHEDTVLGFDLFQNKCEIFHIDNPVEHTGLEDAGVFLEKTRSALKNLNFIFEKLLSGNPDFQNQVWFLNRYKKITQVIPPFFLRMFYRTFSSAMERNLKGNNPRLFWFDVYKLCCFASIKKP